MLRSLKTSLLAAPERMVLFIIFCVSLLMAVSDLKEPFDSFQGELDLSVQLSQDSELIIWNIGTNKVPTISVDELSLPPGWELINHGKAGAYKSIRIKKPGKLSISMLTGKRVRIDSVFTGSKATLGAIYNHDEALVELQQGKSHLVFGEGDYSDLIHKALFLLVVFVAILYFSNRVLIHNGIAKADLAVLLPLFFLFIYINVIWVVSLPGSFTGDSEIFMREARSNKGFSDLVSPFYMIFFKAYYHLFSGDISSIILWHLYSFVLSLYFFINNLVALLFKKSGLKKSYKAVIAIVCCLPILANPVVIGFVTLLYIDPLYVSLMLASLGYFLKTVRLQRGSLLLLSVMFLALVLFRHNSVVLLPILIGMLGFTANLLYAKREYFIDRKKYIISVTLIFIATFTCLHLVINNLIVQKKSNYYIATPIYETVGVVASFQSVPATDFAWMEDYMKVDKLIWRYKKEVALIPVLWESNRRKELDLAAVYKDHSKLWLIYTDLVEKYPLEFSYIKAKHFFYALGTSDFHLTPFFYDRLNKAYTKGEAVNQLVAKGVYGVSKYGGLIEYFRENMYKAQEGAAKYYLSAAIIPFLVSLIGVLVFGVVKILGVNVGIVYPLLAVIALLNISYMFSYLIFSHGAFVKYGLLTYILGYSLIFPVFVSFIFGLYSTICFSAKKIQAAVVKYKEL